MISNGMFSIVAILAIKNILLLIIGKQKNIIIARFMTVETSPSLVTHKLVLSNPRVHLT
jgi:6-phosphogluconolactonase/glucosamine-6-phosphate isomerase/deaminase